MRLSVEGLIKRCKCQILSRHIVISWRQKASHLELRSVLMFLQFKRHVFLATAARCSFIDKGWVFFKMNCKLKMWSIQTHATCGDVLFCCYEQRCVEAWRRTSTDLGPVDHLPFNRVHSIIKCQNECVK